MAVLVGQKKAAELSRTGRSVTGREAGEIGLATRSVPDNLLDSTVQASVAQLLRLSPAALSIAKKASYAWDSIHFDKGLARAEKSYFEELIKTQDAQEGIRAFLEKRPPKWTGH
jgi:cyclohexa-1,5-dienecarbonyl-CoA hydratase